MSDKKDPSGYYDSDDYFLPEMKHRKPKEDDGSSRERVRRQEEYEKKLHVLVEAEKTVFVPCGEQVKQLEHIDRTHYSCNNRSSLYFYGGILAVNSRLQIPDFVVGVGPAPYIAPDKNQVTWYTDFS